jgi:hypothetical protein
MFTFVLAQFPARMYLPLLKYADQQATPREMCLSYLGW